MAIQRPKLSDIASRCDVSIATVSYVLSGREDVHVSSATRSRVLEAAREIGYRRNAVAAALRQGRTGAVALICPGRQEGWTSGLLLAMSAHLIEAGLQPLLYAGREASALDLAALAQGAADGLILLDGPVGEAWLDEVIEAKIPMVEIGSGRGPCVVRADDFDGARSAVRMLLSLGHRRIAHFAGPQSKPEAKERLRGFLDAAMYGRLTMGASPVIYTDSQLEEHFGKVDRPTGVFLASDELGPATYRSARALGLRVPADLSVIGFGDDVRSHSLDPMMASVRVPYGEVCEASVDLLLCQIRGESVPAVTVIPTKLMVRESLARVT